MILNAKILSKVGNEELIDYFKYQIEKIDKKMDFLKTYVDEERYNRIINLIPLNSEIRELSLKELDTRYELVNIDDKITILWYMKLHLNRIVNGLKNTKD